MSTLRDVVGARGGTSPRLWALLALPSLVPVVVIESLVADVTWMLVITTALLQQAVTILPFLVVRRLRASRGVLAVWAFVATWSAIAILRAAVGGLVEIEVNGSAPDFARRTAFWLGIAWIWIPVFVSVAAQLETRTQLARDILDAAARRDHVLEQSGRVEQSLRGELVSTVHSTVIPVIDDIRRGLGVVSDSFDSVSLRAISDRLAVVTEEATRIVAGDPVVPRLSPQPVAPRSPSLVQFAAGGGSPIATATFTAGLLAAVLVPSSAISPRPSDALDVLGAVIASGAVLAVLLFLGNFLLRRLPRSRVWWAIGSALLAGSVGSFVLLQPSPASSTSGIIILAATFPVTVLLASIVVIATGTLHRANDEARERLAQIEQEIADVERSTEQYESSVRAQLATVMHGPVYGRLSACVMALNFSASEQFATTSHRGRVITAGIIDHLDSATRDLDELRNSSPV